MRLDRVCKYAGTSEIECSTDGHLRSLLSGRRGEEPSRETRGQARLHIVLVRGRAAMSPLPTPHSNFPPHRGFAGVGHR